MNDWERTLAWLAGMGALIAVGRALTSKEKLSWKVAVGRTILGSALSTAAALIYIPFPNAPEVVMIGAGAAVGILGEQVLEFAARRLLDFKFGGDPK
jgi:CHASE2 domain-containing sensor protein